MAVKRATLEIESTGQVAHFETDPIAADGQPWNVPALVVEVVDFTEALEVVETLNRSRAQKKRERKPAEAPEKDANPITVKADATEVARLNAKGT